MAEAWIFVAIFATAGALAAGATALSRPFVSLGILFALASVSRITLETPVGTMRLEQPAIALVAAVLLSRGRFRILLSLPRSTQAIALAFGTYLGVLALSSAFVAPDSASSLRIVIWLAISMVGGIVAFTLVWPRPMDSAIPLALGGAATGTAGLAFAVLFFVAGPAFDLGIQEPQSIMPRVQALAWEANLYASFLAMCVPFALELTRGRRRTVGLIILILILVGLPLGETRGAYLGAIAGLAAYAVVRLAWERRPRDLRALSAVIATTLVLGMVASNFLLPNALERRAASGPSPGPSPSGGPSSSGGPSTDPAASGPSPGPSPSGGPGTSPAASLPPYPDTVRFRFDRIPVAVGDLRESPLIGLGAESFGQRHLDPSQQGQPDHLAILAVAAVYESGIVGAAALVIGFVLVLAGLWRVAGAAIRVGDHPSVGSAAAFTGSLLAMLVSYQATNALHFAINWIILGAAVASITRLGTSVENGERRGGTTIDAAGRGPDATGDQTSLNVRQASS